MFKPTNEMGVIVVFSQEIILKTGIELVSINSDFPDATKDTPGIEIEYSRSIYDNIG